MKSFLTVLKLRLKSLFKSGESESEMNREMRFHLESAIEQNIENGMSPQEAQQNAAREFGSVERYKEDCRDSWGVRLLQDLFQDIRYGVRQLIKARGFATIAIFTIAMGIGTSTAIFSVVNDVLFEPMAYKNSERIIQILRTSPQEPRGWSHSTGTYFDIEEQATVFESINASRWISAPVNYDERNMRLTIQQVSTSYFDVHGMPTLLGRGNFRPEEGEPGNNPVAIITNLLWQSQFGGRTDVLNSQIQINEQSYTIIGVVDDVVNRNGHIVTPTARAEHRHSYETTSVIVAGLLKPGVSLKQAQAELDIIASRVARNHPETNSDHGLMAVTFLDLSTRHVRGQLLVLMSAVGFLLIIACANIASLLLARASSRRKELSLRGALGASRGRLIRQLLCESLLISFIGGTLGILLAYTSTGPLARFAGQFVARTQDGISIDTSVLSVAFGLMLIAGLGFGLIPALQATKSDVITALKDSGRGSTGSGQQHSARNTLVIIEIALALILLTGTGLLVRSLHEFRNFDQGLEPLNVSTAQFDLGILSRYNTSEKILNFTNLALERIHALPDVVSTAITTGLPMGGFYNSVSNRPFSLDGNLDTSHTEASLVNYYKITPGYTDVMGIPLIKGRTISAQDLPGSPPVVVVNKEMVQRHFLHEDPIGQRVMIHPSSDEPGIWHTIVGIVGDVKPRGPLSPTSPQFYVPFAQDPQGNMTLVQRAKGPASTISKTVSNIIHAIDPNIAFPGVHDYEARIAYSWSRQRFSMTLFSIFSGIALLLAIIGIYGVMAYTVNERTHEMGIRMALGALPRDVMNLILRGGARIIIFGVLLGAAGSLAGARVLESLLFNTSPYDPATFVSIALILTTVALFACFVPARRATKIDPMIALRAE